MAALSCQWMALRSVGGGGGRRPVCRRACEGCRGRARCTRIPARLLAPASYTLRMPLRRLAAAAVPTNSFRFCPAGLQLSLKREATAFERPGCTGGDTRRFFQVGARMHCRLFSLLATPSCHAFRAGHNRRGSRRQAELAGTHRRTLWAAPLSIVCVKAAGCPARRCAACQPAKQCHFPAAGACQGAA